MIELFIGIFWTGVLIVGYTYVGYGVILFVVSKIKKSYPVPSIASSEGLPFVTILIAAHNEEDYIGEKLRNTLSLDYPREKLSILVVNDGSVDGTAGIVKQFPGVQHFLIPQRGGKIHAVNSAMKLVKTPIVVFCDANTSLNPESVKYIVRHFEDPRVGGVAGEKKIFSKDLDNASGSGEGLYWKYESFLKKTDSNVYSVVGADGGLFSMRTNLFEETAENMIIEDFYMSLRIAMKGFRFVYEPQARAVETASSSVREEWKRKVRICAGGFQAMLLLLPLLNVFRYGILSFQYVSHRMLRWTLAPLSLPLIFISSVVLSFSGIFFYQVSLGGQIFFYAIAFAGYAYQDKKISIKGFFVPYYFTVMNVAVYAGLLRFLKGRQSVMWDKAARAEKG